MKKTILALSLLAVVGTASAHDGFRGYRGGYYHGGCYGCGWVAPALIGGVVGYELAQPRPVIIEQPVIVQQPQYAPAPVGYHYQQMVNPQTGQYQLVLVPN